jgi:hypothetical protein
MEAASKYRENLALASMDEGARAAYLAAVSKKGDDNVHP